jgi:hypothetical protein
MLHKEGVSQDAVVDQLFGLIATENQHKMCVEWLEKGHILHQEDKRNIYELKQSHKNTILTKTFKFSGMSKDTKMELLNKILGGDNSDLAINTRLTCLSGLPDADTKSETWKAITDINSSESLKERCAKMAGFKSWDQLELIRPYFDEFYDVLKHL